MYTIESIRNIVGYWTYYNNRDRISTPLPRVSRFIERVLSVYHRLTSSVLSSTLRRSASRRRSSTTNCSFSFPWLRLCVGIPLCLCDGRKRKWEREKEGRRKKERERRGEISWTVDVYVPRRCRSLESSRRNKVQGTSRHLEKDKVVVEKSNVSRGSETSLP